jgi:RES domain-containing protein
MKTLWRISNHIDLGGWGGRKFSSRWTSLGKRVTYMAESPAGAMLEILVHFKRRDEEVPRTFTLLEIEAPDEIPVQDLMPLADADWKDRIQMTQCVGDRWLDSRETALARVPSAIMPRTWNVLLNPAHPDSGKVRIESVIRERFDNRLFRFGGY